MRQFYYIFIFIFFISLCFGQSDFKNITKFDTTESFTNLTDSLVKNEIAKFNFRGAPVTNNNFKNQFALTEIPLRNCDNKTVHFFKDNIFIHLYFSQGNSKIDTGVAKKLDSIFFVSHSHFLVRFPKSAYEGVVDLYDCNINKEKKKSNYFSPFFKAFRSWDKRRIYIYMIAGRDAERYEVTWVVKDDKFYLRTIDPISQ